MNDKTDATKRQRRYSKTLTVRMTEGDMRYFRKLTNEYMIPEARIVRRLVRGWLKREYDRRKLLGQVTP